jgi:hypothetical protein
MEETHEEKDRTLSSSTVTSRRPIVHKGGNSRWGSGVQSNREGLGLVASKAADPGAHSAVGADDEHDESLGGVWCVMCGVYTLIVANNFKLGAE